MHPDLGYATAVSLQDELVDLAAARRLAGTAVPRRHSPSERARARFGSYLVRLGARLQRQAAPDDIASLRALRIAR